MTADSDSVRFACPKCQKRFKAPASLAGSRTHCPFCHSSLDVPRHSRSNANVELYPLQNGTGWPLDEQPACVLVVCPVCHARMHPEEGQIGRQVICPDCGTATIVTRPAEKPAKKHGRSAEEIGEYPLAVEARSGPGSAPAAEQSYVAVPCALCHTRMLATADQVGGKLICPDCGTATVVPPMPPPRPKIDVMAGAGEGYAIVGWNEKRPVGSSPAPAVRAPADRPEEPLEEPEEPEEPEPKPRRRRPVLPDRPFLDGTFTFPFSRSMWVRTVLLMLWAMLPATIGLAALRAGAVESITTWFTCAMLMAPAVIFGVIWLIAASAAVLVVLRDTSEGCDAIENWPGPVFLDWMWDFLHVFCSVCVSVAPGAAMVWLLGSSGVSAKAPWILSPFFLFPIALMSTLETNSSFGVVSWPVLKTLGSAAAGWARFYAASAVLWAAAGVVGLAALNLNGFIGAILGAVGLTVACIVYFRMVGRLGWYCADRAADLEAQSAEIDDEELDEHVDEEDPLI